MLLYGFGIETVVISKQIEMKVKEFITIHLCISLVFLFLTEQCPKNSLPSVYLSYLLYFLSTEEKAKNNKGRTIYWPHLKS